VAYFKINTEYHLHVCAHGITQYKTRAIRPDMNLELDEFVVRPNQVRGIIQIGTNDFNSEGGGNVLQSRDARHCVSAEVASGKQVRNLNQKIWQQPFVVIKLW
jgi:REP element-mobilizing transposase RayT